MFCVSLWYFAFAALQAASQDVFLSMHQQIESASSRRRAPSHGGSWLTEDGEDTGLPLYWNWCDEGYCSEIKHQYGGSCVDDAKMAALETRVHMHLHYNKSYPHKPPQPVRTFSLQQYMTCKKDKRNRDDDVLGAAVGSYGVMNWIFDDNEGVYSEEDWPQKGDYHTCSMAAHGRHGKGCSNSSCLIDEGLRFDGKSCEKVWGEEQYQKAIDNNDPCECAGNPHLNTWKVPGVIEDFRKDCRKNFVQQNYDPCFCNVMKAKGTKPLYTADELRSMDVTHGISGPGKIKGVGNDTVAEARAIRIRGPANHAVSGYMKHKPVTDDDFNNLKKICFGGDGHFITVVGWNRLGPVPYWIIRNSYGPLYDDHGFIYQNMDCKHR